MSLRIFLEKQPNMVNDIEKEFLSLKLNCTAEEKAVVKLIDKGELIDSNSFIDRFGYKLYTSSLSTGCKTALCVINNPDKVINLVECGLNARDIIISIIRNGMIYLDYNNVTFADYNEAGQIDVSLDDYKFTTIDRLNHYIENERPFRPDMRKAGIEVCTD
jgi:hypothetical protein